MIAGEIVESAALLAGIEPAFLDAYGGEHVVSFETKRALLDARAGHLAVNDRLVAPTVVAYENEPIEVWFFGGAQTYTLTTEDGSLTYDGRVESEPVRIADSLPLGYHTLAVRGADETTAQATVIVAPRRAYEPQSLRDGRAFGLAVQVYTLRSDRNWGMGDFTDLRDFIAHAKSIGASTIGINPLHALDTTDPEAGSPYSPTSRFFLHWPYIDIEALPEFSASPAARELVASAEVQARIELLRDGASVDYRGVTALKRDILEIVYRDFRTILEGPDGSERAAAFLAWANGGGELLERFARYEALTERFASDDGRTRGWLTWPPEYRDPSGEAVASFAAEARERIEFFKYVQFGAEEQLALAGREARDLGIGLYRDLAVGVDSNSADVWSLRDSYLLDASVGAPPDPMNALGQDWGLPPLDPLALRRSGYRPFADLLRSNMAHAGALRIDHVMALARLFWMPRGRPPAEGAYQRYEIDEMTAVVTLESVRAQCLVIGEDLGTVPAGFRERMLAAGICSYRLLLFEREWDGTFRPPEQFPALALASVGTHDLPTLPGYLLGRDIDVRERIGLIGPTVAEAERTARIAGCEQLFTALERHAGLSASDTAVARAALGNAETETGILAPVVLAAYRYIAQSPAKLVLVQIDDIIGERDQINLPGTFMQYANWRRKLAMSVEAIAADDRFKHLGVALAARSAPG